MVNITLPHKFTPRPYQLEALKAMDVYKRVVLIWNRRAWKDKTAFQWFVKKAMERKGVYYYIFPEYEQWRKAFWDNIDNDGLTMHDHIPKQLLKNKNDQSMQIELVNGSLIQVIGTDRKIDNIVGTNPIWLLFSEFPISDPRGWDLLRPIIKLNGGFAWFVFTPRGKNHWWKLREVSRKNPEVWYLSEKTVLDTTDNEWNRIVTDQMIDEERRDGMDEDLVQQEYFCSFEASVKGAYYADQMREARTQGRIGKVPYEPTLEVHTHWDLGINDTTAIWFWQAVHWEFRIIDHYETSGEPLLHYVEVLKNKWYNYGKHYLPHDVEVKELQTGQTRRQYLEAQWLKVEVVEKLWVEEGIEMGRRIFSKIWIDEDKCERGINSLSSYHKEYDNKNQTFRTSPKHDWSSNSADAFRYFAVTNFKNKEKKSFWDNVSIQSSRSPILDKWGWKFYAKREQSHKYAIGCTISEWASIVVIDCTIKEVVAEYYSQYALPDVVWNELSEKGYLYNTAYIGINADKYGTSIVSIMKGKNYPSLYQNMNESGYDDTETDTLWVVFTPKTKGAMITQLVEGIKYLTLLVPSHILLQELEEYPRDNAEKIDDEYIRVVALAIAFDMLKKTGYIYGKLTIS